MNVTLKKRLEGLIGRPLTQLEPVGGGDLGTSYCARQADGSKLFVDGHQVGAKLDEELVHLLSGSREVPYDMAVERPTLLDLLFDFTKRGWGYLLSGDDD